MVCSVLFFSEMCFGLHASNSVVLNVEKARIPGFMTMGYYAHFLCLPPKHTPTPKPTPTTLCEFVFLNSVPGVADASSPLVHISRTIALTSHQFPFLEHPFSVPCRQSISLLFFSFCDHVPPFIFKHDTECAEHT